MSYEFNNLVVVEKWTNRKNSDVFQNISTFYSKGDNRLDAIMSLPMTMRLYSLTGMHILLEAAGWENIANYKSLSRLEPVDRDSEMIVTIYDPK
jgi:hypothetical protein